MEHAQRARRRVLADVERAAGGSLSPSALFDRTLAALEAVLDIEGACWHVTDPSSGLPVAGGRAGNPAGDFRRSLEYEFLRDDVLTFAELGRMRTPVGALGLRTGGEPWRSARFREMIAPGGVADELRMVVRDGFGRWGCLTLHVGRPLDPRDEELAAALVAPLARGLRAARALDGAPVQPARVGPAVVVLDGADAVARCDARARELLVSLTGSADVLPGALHVLAAQVRRDGAGSARMRDASGGWLVADGSLLEEDPRGEVALVIQAAPQDGILDAALRAHGLSAREREIAALAVQGRSTKAIAAELHLSPWTVQDHLKAGYEKTGVGGRGELAMLTARAASATPTTPGTAAG